jgi:hypothetical protein
MEWCSRPSIYMTEIWCGENCTHSSFQSLDTKFLSSQSNLSTYKGINVKQWRETSSQSRYTHKMIALASERRRAECLLFSNNTVPSFITTTLCLDSKRARHGLKCVVIVQVEPEKGKQKSGKQARATAEAALSTFFITRIIIHKQTRQRGGTHKIQIVARRRRKMLFRSFNERFNPPLASFNNMPA